METEMLHSSVAGFLYVPASDAATTQTVTKTEAATETDQIQLLAHMKLYTVQQ